MKKIAIYTSSSCFDKSGPGGYAIIFEYKERKKEITGGSKSTTNNRMELTAVIEALSILTEPCEATIYTDSKYVVDTVDKKWIFLWKNNNWAKSNKLNILNVDLWNELLSLLIKHKVNFVWIKEHTDNINVLRCNKLAIAAAFEQT